MPTGRFSPKIYPGAKLGLLTVIRRIPKTKTERSKVLCQCDCGKEVVVNAGNLSSGNSKSCGCQKYAGMLEYTKGKIGTGAYGTVVPGAVFSRLTVIKRIWKGGSPTTRVKCKCSCGVVKIVGIDGLMNESVKSCGCLNREKTAARNRENAKYDGFSKKYPMTFRTWKCVMHRTYHPSEPGSEVKRSGYGEFVATTISCKYLRKSPWNFLKVMGKRPTKAHTIDRFPIHNGPYACGECKDCRKNGWERNVRWATRKQQAENRGQFNVQITAFGCTFLLSQWEEKTGLDARRIKRRIYELGWSPERALTTPDRKGHCYHPDV